MLITNPLFYIVQTDFPQLLDCQIAIAHFFFRPINIGMHMSHRYQNIKRAFPLGRQSRISNTGVLNIKRWVFGKNMSFFNIQQIALIIA